MTVVRTKRTKNKVDARLETKPVAQMANQHNDWLSRWFAGQSLQRLSAKIAESADSVSSVRLTNKKDGCTDNWRGNSLMIQPIRCVNI